MYFPLFTGTLGAAHFTLPENFILIIPIRLAAVNSTLSCRRFCMLHLWARNVCNWLRQDGLNN